MWLSIHLRSLAEDIIYNALYAISEDDESSAADDVEADVSLFGRNYRKDAAELNVGAHICEKYLYGSITLDSFCAQMVDEDLKEFLINIPDLPIDLVAKFGLVHDDAVNPEIGVQTKDSELPYDAALNPKIDVPMSKDNESTTDVKHVTTL
jgi:hypothetical protein